MKVKCPCCKGAKAIMGPGCIYKPCKECKGKGEIEREEPKPSFQTLTEAVKAFDASPIIRDIRDEQYDDEAKVKKVVKVTPENKKKSRSKK